MNRYSRCLYLPSFTEHYMCKEGVLLNYLYHLKFMLQNFYKILKRCDLCNGLLLFRHNHFDKSSISYNISSRLQEYLEQMFIWHYIPSDIFSILKYSTIQWCITRCHRVSAEVYNSSSSLFSLMSLFYLAFSCCTKSRYKAANA